MPGLPIEPSLPELRAALRGVTSAVLQAPPGAGKTTLVPLALLDEAWLAGGRIVLLEPRRLAARAAASRMAHLLGEAVGETVGYRMRLDSVIGPRTRIEVVTEGVLTRLLLDDPSLGGVGAVIFDEFHERSLHADLGLALTLHARSLFRADLRVLVMSATLDAAPVAALLEDAPVLTAQGTSFPVQTRYLGRPQGRIEGAIAAAVRLALAEDPGDVLVFLPGAAEIRRTAQTLEPLGRAVRIAPLYGDLSQEEQGRAIAPSPPGWRKVVLATSIAETSLTIEGVGVVIDSGLMRVPRFSPRTGLSRLETVPVTRASAEQRRGRAGRLGPGVCYRLWSEPEQAGLVPHRAPEILEADLAPLALELAAWGVADPHELAWLDAPPAAAFAQAVELLAELGALHGGGVTPHGRRMAGLPAHPRLAHMLILARRLQRTDLACDLAALLGERDVLRRSETPTDPDTGPRLDALRRARQRGIHGVHTVAGREVDRVVLHRVLREAEHWRRRLRLTTERTNEPSDVTHAGQLLAFAFPDRIARRRPGGRGRFLLRSGRGAAMEQDTALAGEEFIVAAEVDARGAEGRVFLAAPLTRAELDADFAAAMVVDDDVSWDPVARRVRALRRLRLGAIVLEEKPARDVDADRLAAVLLAGVAREGLASLTWSDEARRLQQRVAFLRKLEPDTWPDVTDANLAVTLADWLGPFAQGLTSIEELGRLDLARVLGGLLPPAARPALDALAPPHLLVPSGSRIPIDYTDPDAPAVAVRLQEVFGLRETPRIGGGRVPLTFRLLSPAQRPVQVTRDLASFWRSGYFEVRKDLKGRYPKHDWPLDPLTAQPTRRARPRR